MALLPIDIGTRWKVWRFARFLRRNTESLTQRFGASEAALMRREMLDEYRSLIPQVPNIGGRRNPSGTQFGGIAWVLAGSRVVPRHGGG